MENAAKGTEPGKNQFAIMFEDRFFA